MGYLESCKARVPINMKWYEVPHYLKVINNEPINSIVLHIYFHDFQMFCAFFLRTSVCKKAYSAGSFISVIKEEKCSNNLELGAILYHLLAGYIFCSETQLPLFSSNMFLNHNEMDFNTKSMFDALCEKTCYLLGHNCKQNIQIRTLIMFFMTKHQKIDCINFLNCQVVVGLKL